MFNTQPRENELSEIRLSKPDIRVLYERYGGMVFRRCQSILKNDHLAMDALQDVFVQVMKNPYLLKGSGLSSLFYRIATNVSLNLLRHRQVRENYECVQKSFMPDEHYEGSSTEDSFLNIDRINKALNQFPERTREVALYHYVDGFTMDEIAAMMRISNSNVRRILRELRQVACLQEETI